jgi:hypothetical protein
LACGFLLLSPWWFLWFPLFPSRVGPSLIRYFVDIGMSTCYFVDTMQTLISILRELQSAGCFTPGFHVRIENNPYMALVIEDICELGPRGYRTISVAHYGEQNGDLMRDPEMLFELMEHNGNITLLPYYWRNDYVGIEKWSLRRGQSGEALVNRRLQREHSDFAKLWDKNLAEQGFLVALQWTLHATIGNGSSPAEKQPQKSC